MTVLIDALAESVAEFGPRTQRFPVYLVPPPGEEVVAAETMLGVGDLHRFFLRALAEWIEHPDMAELIAAGASRFMRRYCGSMVSATLIPLTEGVAVDVSLPRVSLVVRDEMPMGAVVDLEGGAVATSSERPTAWPITGETLGTAAALRERALHSLFADNLMPALRRVHEEVHLSRRLMWATVAEQIDALYETAIESGDPRRRGTLAEDRDALFTAGSLPGVPGENPLRDVLDWGQAGHPRTFCCICYVIPGRNGPDRDSHCRGCPMLTLTP
ncbi:MAG: ferric iron reductase [Acidimicrobiales bacterium]